MNLQKMKKADTWPAALQGRNARVDPITLEGMQKKIMLERFQNEVCVLCVSTRFAAPYPTPPHPLLVFGVPFCAPTLVRRWAVPAIVTAVRGLRYETGFRCLLWSVFLRV